MLVGELTGIAGWAEGLMNQLGEWGVGLFTLLETVFPPIPSEMILPLAGYLAQQGQLELAEVIVSSTVGAYLGAMLLYGRAPSWVKSVRSDGCRNCLSLTAAISIRPTSGLNVTADLRSSSADWSRAYAA